MEISRRLQLGCFFCSVSDKFKATLIFFSILWLTKQKKLPHLVPLEKTAGMLGSFVSGSFQRFWISDGLCRVPSGPVSLISH